ncbi:hypothetical protein P2318_23275 [Myxococcaceae bacterium GXIMD 01537]
MVTMSRSKVVGVVLALLAGGLVLAFWPREEPGVKEAVSREIIAMTRAAQEKDVGAIMEHVSERFRAAQGWDKQQVRGVLVGQVLRGQWVRVFTTNLEVTEVTPTRADYRVKIIFGRSPGERIEDLSRETVLSAYLLEGAFEKEDDGQWRVVSARHQSLAPTDLL